VPPAPALCDKYSYAGCVSLPRALYIRGDRLFQVTWGGVGEWVGRARRRGGGEGLPYLMTETDAERSADDAASWMESKRCAPIHSARVYRTVPYVNWDVIPRSPVCVRRGVVPLSPPRPRRTPSRSSALRGACFSKTHTITPALLSPSLSPLTIPSSLVAVNISVSLPAPSPSLPPL
jgi:hypothetical protein